MRERSLTVDGMELRLATVGEGQPVLFVHGLGGAWSSWRPTLEGLAGGHRLIAPDLPGFGRSAKPQEADYGPCFFVDTTVALLDELGVRKAHVVGSSMGGQIALELALRHPERVRRVATLAPAGVPPRTYEGTDALQTYRGIVDAEGAADVAAILDAIHPDELPAPEHGREPAEIHAYADSPGAGQAFEASLEASARARRLGPHLDEIDPPPLIVWGQRDPMIPWDVVEPVLAKARRPAVVVFPETGHSPHTERPVPVNALLSSFLAEASLEPVRRTSARVHQAPADTLGS